MSRAAVSVARSKSHFPPSNFFPPRVPRRCDRCAAAELPGTHVFPVPYHPVTTLPHHVSVLLAGFADKNARGSGRGRGMVSTGVPTSNRLSCEAQLKRISFRQYCRPLTPCSSDARSLAVTVTYPGLSARGGDEAPARGCADGGGWSRAVQAGRHAGTPRSGRRRRVLLPPGGRRSC